MTYLAPIDRAKAEPVLTLITDHDRAAEGRAMADDIDTVLSRAPIHEAEEASLFWVWMAFAVCAGLASLTIAFVLPMEV